MSLKHVTMGLLALSMTWGAGLAARAQDIVATPPTYSSPGGSSVPAGVVSIPGIDSGTNKPCLIGKASTCQVPTNSSGGGGAITAAAGAIVDLGTGGSPAAGTVNSNLVQLHTDNGTDGTGITQPTGGVGTRGWLSGTYNALTIGPVPISNAASSVTGSVSAATITNSSVQYVAAASRKLLVIDNESATASIACAFGATAALNTAGSFTIPPQNTRVWNSYPVPADAVNCISSVASSPATIEAN